MTTDPSPPRRGTYVPISEQELILRDEKREISLLLANEHLSLTYGSCAAGERIAGPHIHNQHTDAFYVLEGELTFEIGPGPETISIGAGSLVAAPPAVSHSLRNAGPQRARWLTIHAPDGGFADFMRGIRDGVQIEWDIAQSRRTADYPQTTPSSAGPSGDTWRACQLSWRKSDAMSEQIHSSAISPSRTR